MIVWGKITRFLSSNQFVGPTEEMTYGDYKNSFDSAVEFTRICGFKEIPPTWITGDILDDTGNFIEPVYRAAGVTDPTNAAGQCLKWCC